MKELRCTLPKAKRRAKHLLARRRLPITIRKSRNLCQERLHQSVALNRIEVGETQLLQENPSHHQVEVGTLLVRRHLHLMEDGEATKRRRVEVGVPTILSKLPLEKLMVAGDLH